MTPAIDSSAIVEDESITIANMNRLERPAETTALESPVNKKARIEKGKILLRVTTFFVDKILDLRRV